MNMMTMRMARDAAGVTRHVPAPFVPGKPAKKGKAKVKVADPIKTNGESAAEQLRLIIERIERLDEELCGLQQDRADVLSEAKSTGFDVKGIRAILTLRKQEKHIRDENDAILETYRAALGMQ